MVHQVWKRGEGTLIPAPTPRLSSCDACSGMRSAFSLKRLWIPWQGLLKCNSPFDISLIVLHGRILQLSSTTCVSVTAITTGLVTDLHGKHCLHLTDAQFSLQSIQVKFLGVLIDFAWDVVYFLKRVSFPVIMIIMMMIYWLSQGGFSKPFEELFNIEHCKIEHYFERCFYWAFLCIP